MVGQVVDRQFRSVELVGQRARLRPVRLDDAPALFDLLRDDRVVRTLLIEAPASLADEEQWCRRMASDLPTRDKDGRSTYALAIERVDQAGVTGVIGLHRRFFPRQIETGYWLGVPYWGQGLATDAVRLAVHFAFRYLDAIRVFATVFAGNVASRRVLEKNGFHLDATRRCQVLKRGEWLDDWFFTLLRSEWEARSTAYVPKSERIIPTA